MKTIAKSGCGHVAVLALVLGMLDHPAGASEDLFPLQGARLGFGLEEALAGFVLAELNGQTLEPTAANCQSVF